MEKRELVIIGGGPAGMAAAISAHESGVKDILLLERDLYLGGLLNQCIHTGFGLTYFKETLTGPEYASRFVERVRAIPSIEVVTRAFAVRLTGEKTVDYLIPGHMVSVRAKAVVMATGSRERTREMAHIAGTRPAGIFPAGLAQRLINIEGYLPGKNVVIVGSGDIGLIMARRFKLEGAEVKAVIEIQPVTRGLVRNVVQCLDDFGIPLYFRHKIAHIYGKDRVEGVDVIRVDEEMREIEGSRFSMGCDTLLVSVGLIPENELIEMAGAELDKKSNTPVSGRMNETSLPGIFVCGNSYKVYDIVDTVSACAENAGRMAAGYLGKVEQQV